MKYFHVIFNSSEKGIDGGRGFGFRTYTKDTPEAYLNALRENGLLDYSQGNREEIMPLSLKNDPDLIKTFPASYFFRSLPLEGGKRVFALGRTVPVGFDFTFYVKYAPGRMGNYVTDCYLFEDLPSPEVFQIFYGNPSPGSNRFVPLDPSPKESNEEMKMLSLGSQELLPMEDKPFSANGLPPVSDVAVRVLFSLIDAKRQNKALAVMCDWELSASLMADLYRLMPIDVAAECGFVSNYQDEGLPKNTPIVLVNQFYPYSVSANLSVKFQASEPWTETLEYVLFGVELKSDLKNGNWEAVHRRVRWMFGDAFRSVMEKSKKVNDSFYQYCVDTDLFSLNLLRDNDEFVSVLADFFSKDPRNQLLFNSLVDAKVKSVSNETEAVKCINFLEWLTNKRIDVSSIIDKYRSLISQKLAPSALKFVESVGKLECSASLRNRYLDRDVLASKNSFLDDPSMKPIWLDFYGYFFPEHVLKGDSRGQVLSRMVDLGFDSKSMLTVLGELYADEEKKSAANYVKSQIAAHPDKVSVYWQILVRYLTPEQLAFVSTDFLGTYQAQLGNDDFAPLFYKQLSSNGVSIPADQALPQLRKWAETNCSLKRLMSDGFSLEKKLYPSILSDIEESIISKGAKETDWANLIKENVLDCFDASVTKDWNLLYLILNGVTDGVTEQNLDDIIALSLKLHDKSLLDALLDRCVVLAKPEQASLLVKAMSDVLNLNLEGMLEKVGKTGNVSADKDFYKEILLSNQVEIKDAEQLLSDKKISLDKGGEEDFLQFCYGDKYNSYKRKRFLVDLIKKPFHLK